MKYVDAKVVFAEIPDEITLAINISGCPVKCSGCHSKYLWEDVGEPLNSDSLHCLIENHKGITCVAFMGGDSSPYEIKDLAMFIRVTYPKLKIAWYSGRETIPNGIMLNLQDFDFIKLGSYKEEVGPLNSESTNQRMYRVHNGELEDITNKFWKNDKDNNARI